METKQHNYSGPLWLIIILLILVLGSNLYTIFTTYQAQQIESERAATYSERVEEAQELLADQRELVADLLTSYQEDAYGENVDRIAEQQLLAAEYQLLALQVIALQNSQVIELLAAAP